ncbi:MAG: efflux RND transporter periplasmic adaptor subunit [Clostridiales bacterium]|nr:efflux RND transporter periplasmic adaptor subunit [Clostridiales bacterium]
MSDENRKRKNKKWIVKALVIFLIVMGILTFFSNTIMNMTLTQVSTQQIYSATLSSITRASGVVQAATQKEVKAPGELTVEGVNTYLYGYVEEGDVLATFKLPEDRTDLETAKKNLADLEKEMEYDERTPSESNDYYPLEMAVQDAEKGVETAQKNLDAAYDKDSAIERTRNEITQLNDDITELQKKKVEVENSKSESETRRDELREKIDPCKWALEKAQEALDACITDPNDPAFDQAKLDKCTADVQEAQQDVDDVQAAFDRANDRIVSYGEQIIDIENSISDKQNLIEEKELEITGYEAISSVEDAKRALSDAEHDLAQARKTLSDTRARAGVSYDQAEDAKNAKLKQKEDYEKEIARLEEYYSVTDVKAPISGMIIAVNVNRGGQCMKDEVMFTIADMDSEFYIECSIPKKDAEGMYIGSEVKTDMCDGAVVESIRPDPSSPMDSNIVRITVWGSWLTPGATTVNCTISTSNRNYENVVPKGAVQQDTEGDFIYILVTKNSPLGERYIARKVSVKVLAEDATSCAIEGAGINYAYCIVRTGKPIKNGEQVRLAQGETN